MAIYVVLLKGINVGGNHKIKMADLKQQLHNTNVLSNVQTYIQSGNIVLSSDLSCSDVEHIVEETIQNHYGFHIATKAFTQDEWLSASEDHPYFNEATDIKMLHLTFLYKIPDSTSLKDVLTFKPDNEHCSVIDTKLYLYYPDGFGRSKFNSALIERKLKCNTTSRNWRTVQKLRSMLLDTISN